MDRDGFERGSPISCDIAEFGLPVYQHRELDVLSAYINIFIAPVRLGSLCKTHQLPSGRNLQLQRRY